MTPSLVANELVGALIVIATVLPLVTLALLMTWLLASLKTTALAVEPEQGS